MARARDTFILSTAAVTGPGAANIDRITDYESGDVVDITQILNVSSGTNMVSGGYARVTTNGQIQVDLDGGGDDWVTLSTINNGGSVTLRYLSGGVATSIAVSRVADAQQVANSQVNAMPASDWAGDDIFRPDLESLGTSLVGHVQSGTARVQQ